MRSSASANVDSVRTEFAAQMIRMEKIGCAGGQVKATEDSTNLIPAVHGCGVWP